MVAYCCLSYMMDQSILHNREVIVLLSSGSECLCVDLKIMFSLVLPCIFSMIKYPIIPINKKLIMM